MRIQKTIVCILVICSFFPYGFPSASSIPDIKSVIQTPIEPPPNMVVNIVSVVVDNIGLVNVSLFYSINSSSWTSEMMVLIDGNNYNGTFLVSIPGQAVGTHVSYYVYALDTFGYSTQSTIQNYTVTKDTKQPHISGIEIVEPPPPHITPWDSVQIRAQIKDSGSGVENATLLYGLSEPYDETTRALFLKASMILTDGDKHNGTYVSEIPPQQNNTIVWYYIEANDVAGNKRTSDYSGYEVFLSTRSWLSVIVQIAEIDTKDLSATLNVFFSARLPSPFEQGFLVMHAYNARRNQSYANFDIFEVNLSPTERFWYQSTTTWKVSLRGNPNCFPYDRYTLELTFVAWWSKIDDLQINDPFFNDYRLSFVWEDPKILNKATNHTSEYPEVSVNLQLNRNADDRLPVILPILALFFMLGATLSVDSKTHLRSRLTVYLTSFVFIVGFFYTIASLVPLRFGFTIAELMVITLTLATVALVVASFISASLSEHRCQVLISACVDIAAVLVIFGLMLFMFGLRYTQTPLLLSIPLEHQIAVVVGVVYGLAIRTCLNRKQLKKQLAHARARLRDFTRNIVKSPQGEEPQSSKRAAVPNQVAERLDRAFDLILLLIGIISAAILQYVAALGDMSLTTFSMRFLFIPLIPIILFWLWNRITNNLNTQVFIRMFAWFLGVFTLFSDILFFLLLSFLRQFVTSLASTLVVSIVLYVIAFFLDRRIKALYGYMTRDLVWMGVASYALAIATTVVTIILTNLPMP